ncbi:hypothetical protein C4E44_14065 [Pseudomonas sp. MWU12-2312b]|nr:hypothetical protein C4E44_14065 [Pseudomonas sp. MWU12-2312b]
MTKHFDLTTREGMKKALDGIQDKLGFMPLLWAVGKIIDSTSPASAVTKQADAASEIIREGKRSGVDSMTIVMDEQAGAHFKAPIDGVEISASLGSKGKVTIDVKYK